MGQAKRRGTFEERKAQAIERRDQERKARARRKNDAPVTREGTRQGVGRLAMLMALLASTPGSRR